MFGKIRLSQWLVGAVILTAAECVSVAAIGIALTVPAEAQFFGDDRYYGRQRYQRPGGFFDGLFGAPNRQIFEGESSQAPADNSRAPSPRKADPKAEPVTPTTSIMVMGDGMADWLAYGLEDAFSDAPEIAIVRKNKQRSGLLHYDVKGDLDWWHAARDMLTQEKPNYVIMMLGVSDRQNIREKDLAKEADKKEADKKKTADPKDKPDASKTDANKSVQSKEGTPDKESDDSDQPSIMAPEGEPGKKANGVIEFRTDQWAQIYSRRIDETVAALKSRGVPVFWVGLPSIKGPKSTADAVYLNDLYRARAEKAGAIYIDVWDGFVDEGGKFTTNGPDYEGQIRRLRSGDGVYFTKYGARKLAHYVERELRRYMSNRSLQVSLPTGPVAPLPADAKSTVRPLVGPVVPLTVTPGNSEELLGGPATSTARGDAIATQVLVKGEPVAAPPGRADNFAWQGGTDANASQPATAAPISMPLNDPIPVDKKADGSAGKAGQGAKSKQAEDKKPKPVQHNNSPRPPQPIRPAGPFGWLR